MFLCKSEKYSLVQYATNCIMLFNQLFHTNKKFGFINCIIQMKNWIVYSLPVKTYKYKMQTIVYEQNCIQFGVVVQIENNCVFTSGR